MGTTTNLCVPSFVLHIQTDIEQTKRQETHSNDLTGQQHSKLVNNQLFLFFSSFFGFDYILADAMHVRL